MIVCVCVCVCVELMLVLYRKGSEYSKKVVVLSRHEMLQFQSSNDSTPNHPGIGRGHYYAKEPETFDDLFTRKCMCVSVCVSVMTVSGDSQW